MKTVKNACPKNIIVRMPNWVGDLVMATAVLSDIKRVFPYVKLTVLARENVSGLLKNDTDINCLFCLKKQNIFFRNKANKQVIEELKKTNFDYGILLTNSFSSAYLFYKANIKNIIGYKNDFRSFFIEHSPDPLKINAHQIIKYKNLLAPLGIAVSDTRPRLFLDIKEIDKAKDILYGNGFNDTRRLIGISPFAKYGRAKCWPADRFRQAAEILANDKKNFIVFTGDNYSRTLVDDICGGLPKNVISLAGKTNLRELACVIKLCSLFLTNDSGPMHIASALDIPLLALFGSTSSALTGPYNEKAVIINKKAECSPCFKRRCSRDFKCMNQIAVDEVLNKINVILK